LLGVGYDSDRERSLSYTLVVSTLFITFASGYTTWLGLCEYLPRFVALLLTLGIQGLLYAASWRLGGSLNTRAFRLPLLVIYLVTALTSIFFSYSALLDAVYRPAQRQRDQLQRAQIEATDLDVEISSRLDSEFQVAARRVRQDVRAWYEKLATVADPQLAARESEARRVAAEQELLEKRAAKESAQGGTVAIIAGKRWMTPPGYGPFAQGYEQVADEHRSGELSAAQGRYQELKERLSTIRNLQQLILKDDAEVTSVNLARLETLRGEVAAILSADGSAAAMLQKDLFSNATMLAAQTAANLESARTGNAVRPKEGVRSVDSLKAALLARLQEVSGLAPKVRDELLERVARLGALQGAGTHQFALAIGELMRGNLLAGGALLVAITIDVLILLCGILAARPVSYLDMRSPDDLMDIQELAIQTIMSIAAAELEPADIASPFVRRCLEILDRADIDTDLAYSGFPAILSPEAVEELHLLEVGVLLALRVAERLPNGGLALRTRFVLWLADLVQRGLLHQSTFADVRQTLEEADSDV
jgi:hypothetical protein